MKVDSEKHNTHSHYFCSIIAKVNFTPLIPILLLTFYYLSLPLKLVLAISCFSIALAVYKKHPLFSPNKFISSILLIFLCIFPLIVLSVQIAQLHNGTQGIDFAIFSQLVHNISTRNELQSSLIDSQWHHFLTHHLSPYLYIVGFVDKAFGNPEITLLVLHSVTVASIALLFFTTALSFDKDIRVALLLTSFVILLPAPRVALLWEVRDEIFALPFILAAYLLWSKNHHARAATCLIATMLFKETMFIATCCFSIMAIAMSYLNDTPNPRRTRAIYCLCFILGGFGFLLYTKILPRWIFWPTFSTFERVSTISQLLEPNVLRAKIWWLTTIIAPVIPLLILGLFKISSSTIKTRKRYLLHLFILLLPAAPFVGAILISNFGEMHKPYIYYSILPALLTTMAVFISLKTLPAGPKITALLIGCLIAISIGPRPQIPAQIQTALTTESPVERLRQMIPTSAVVITGDWDAPFFIKQRQVMRIYHANRSTVKFDFIVQRKTSPSSSASVKLSRYLRSWSEICFEDDTWIVRCAYPSARPVQAKTELSY